QRNGSNVVYVQRLDTAGTPKLAIDGVEVSPVTASAQLPLTGATAISFATPDGQGGASICWGDPRSGNAEVYGQRFDPLGAPMWPTGGVLVAPFPNSDLAPCVAPDGAGGIIVAWQRQVSLSPPARDMFVSRIAPQGGTFASGVEEARSPGPAGRLLQNRPNPFNPRTTIGFDLTRNGHVSLVVYDIQGRFVARLLDGVATAGRNLVSWDGRDERGRSVSSGVYVYRLEAGELRASRRMVLLK